MIELKGVSFAYVKEDVIKDVNLLLGPGVTAIIGPNGSGKTTLLKLAAGIYRPRVGEVLIDGINPWSVPETVKTSIRRNVVYIHEEPIMLRGSVADNVAYGLRIRKLPADEVVIRTEEVLEVLGIKHLAHEKAQTLSAGQKQRVALARALAVRPKNLLLDEPTANLDRCGRETLMELVKDLVRKGVCIAIATHDRLLAFKLTDRVVFVENKTAIFVEGSGGRWLI